MTDRITLLLMYPNEPNYANVVLYEIDMLRFTAARMERSRWEHSRDAWVFEESFLTHFRSLLEFFGGEPTRNTDLCVKASKSCPSIWERLNVSAPADVDHIHAKGGELLRKYERVEDRISAYLHHCTTKRTKAKQWRIGEMVSDIEQLIARVEPILRKNSTDEILPSELPVTFLAPHDVSTATCTFTAVMPRLIRPSMDEDL